MIILEPKSLGSGCKQLKGDLIEDLSECFMLRDSDIVEDNLLNMIEEDFCKYIQCIDESKNHKVKLRCTRRESLDPYVLDSDKPLSYFEFGEVYVCTYKITKKKFSLKLIKSARINDTMMVDLLLDVLITMLLMNSSPFVIHLEEYFALGNKVLPIDQLQLIALVLNEMYHNKLIHRDIKSKKIVAIKKTIDNQVLTDIRIADFGLTNDLSEYQMLRESIILKTVDYFSPELCDMIRKRMSGEVAEIRWMYGLVVVYCFISRCMGKHI
jgi:hypothetical protein